MNEITKYLSEEVDLKKTFKEANQKKEEKPRKRERKRKDTRIVSVCQGHGWYEEVEVTDNHDGTYTVRELY